MSISFVIFSDSQSRLYSWLFGQPERAFHLNELLRLTGLGSASLQRELNRLATAGLARVSYSVKIKTLSLTDFRALPKACRDFSESDTLPVNSNMP